MGLLISGYGGKSGDTAGVYDLEEERFIWRSGIGDISFMCSGGDGTFFGAGENESCGFIYMFTPENAAGGISAPKANGTADSITPGGYKLAGKIQIDGSALCHIAYSKKHKILTGACYGSGDIFSAEVKPGGFGEMKSYIRQGGAEAELTRAHCTVFGEGEDELFSANIALDKIFRYEIENGCLRESGYQQLAKGVGPRHILLINGWRYVITEYSNEIIPLNNDGRRISALPEGFAGKSSCSAMCFLPVTSDYGYLYAANRGADTVAVFKHDNKNGTLEKIHDCSCGGNWPRHMDIIGGERGGSKAGAESSSLPVVPLLAVANQHSGEVVFFEINADGSLGREKLKVPFEGAAYVGEL